MAQNRHALAARPAGGDFDLSPPEVLAPLEISLFCGLRPFLQFLTGLASNGMSGYIKS